LVIRAAVDESPQSAHRIPMELSKKSRPEAGAASSSKVSRTPTTGPRLDWVIPQKWAPNKNRF